jgi:hypothetical protein
VNPYEYYGKEFRDKGGWGAWLGMGRVSNWNRVFLTYDEAVQIVHPLKIKNQREWRAYRPKPTNTKGGWPGRWHQFERKELTPKSETTTKPAKGLVNAKTQLRSKRLRKRHKVLAPEASSRRLNRLPREALAPHLLRRCCNDCKSRKAAPPIARIIRWGCCLTKSYLAVTRPPILKAFQTVRCKRMANCHRIATERGASVDLRVDFESTFPS